MNIILRAPTTEPEQRLSSFIYVEGCDKLTADADGVTAEDPAADLRRAEDQAKENPRPTSAGRGTLPRKMRD